MKTLAITLVVLIALLFAVAWAPVIQARNAWRAGENAEAIAIADRWSQLRLWPGDYQQILAAAFLTAGNDSAAQPHLAAIGTVWIPAIDKTEVARQLFARGRYADFLAYDAASRERKDPDEVRLYRAAAQTVTNHVDAAGATLSRLPGGRVALYAMLLALVVGVTAVLNLDTSALFLTPVLVQAARSRGVEEQAGV